MFASKSCPCKSGKSLAQCCAPYLDGRAKSKTAEALLRARYTAFATGKIDYLLATHHPDKRADVSRGTIEEWSKGSDWLGLTLVESTQGGTNDDEGTIEFVASYRQAGKDINHHEVALFKRHAGAWYFYDVVKYKQKPVKNETPPIGRNDPCPCGSGKKYKKCCG